MTERQLECPTVFVFLNESPLSDDTTSFGADALSGFRLRSEVWPDIAGRRCFVGIELAEFCIFRGRSVARLIFGGVV